MLPSAQLRRSTSLSLKGPTKRLAYGGLRQLACVSRSGSWRMAERSRRLHGESGSTAQPRLGMVQRHFTGSAPGPEPRSTASSTSASSSSSGVDAQVTFANEGHLRVVTLTRTKALNALNKEMVDLMRPKLEKWETGDSAKLILLEGNGRAFCAGGDVVTLANYVASEDPEVQKQAVTFFKGEYDLDAFIAKMTKPVVCLLDGITMGGGLGLSVHTPFRVATEKTRVAMPETTIGLFPDVGASFFLARLDGQIGTYLGLTSENLTGWSAYLAGFATHYVPSSSLPSLRERLSEIASNATHDVVDEALNEFSADPEEGSSSAPYKLIGPLRQAIDHCFSKKTVEDIVRQLKAVESGSIFSGHDLEGWAKETRETIEKRSPTSCKITLAALRQGKEMNIDEVFLMDMRLAAACCDMKVHPDFHTGVTHLLVNKLKTRADWSPATLEDVKAQAIHDIFFSSKAPPTTQVLPLSLTATKQKPYTQYPFRGYGLPSEEDVERVVTGEAKGSGSLSLTRDEVIETLQRRWKGKVGLRQKVEEILDRKTKEGGEKESRTLRWLH